MMDTDADKGWWTKPWLQILVCVAIYGVLAWRFWPTGTVLLSPLLAAAIARPIMNLVADVRHKMRESVWLPLHGDHYVYKSTTIRVLEDESHWRWVCLDDVRKVIPFNATENALNVTYPGRFERERRLAYLRDDALMEHLAKATHDAPIRFRSWVEKNVFGPAAKARERLGVKPEVAEAD